jgi:ATP-dependent Clp protease ATP-binding subunit ClpA
MRVVQWSEHARRVLDLAWQEADRFGHHYLGPEHLVLGVLCDDGSGAARVLEARGVDLAAARAALGHLADRGVVAGPRPSDAELLGMLGIDLEAPGARGGGGGGVPRTPLGEPPMLISQALQHAGEQARALGVGVVGPELLLLGVVTDIRTPWPRCMRTRWTRQLHASVGLPEGYRGAAGPLLQACGVDLEELGAALVAALGAGVP